jgi:hypothetical protein
MGKWISGGARRDEIPWIFCWQRICNAGFRLQVLVQGLAIATASAMKQIRTNEKRRPQ